MTWGSSVYEICTRFSITKKQKNDTEMSGKAPEKTTKWVHRKKQYAPKMTQNHYRKE